MTKDVLKYLQPNAVIPIDMETTTALVNALKERLAQPEQEPKLPEIFCGVDYADGVLSVSVMRRRPDDVAELLHSEQIELEQPAETSAERTLRTLGYTNNGGEFWKPPLGAWPPQRTEQEPDDIASIIACRNMLDAQPVPPKVNT
jgi:hypothetical protein